MTGLPLHTSDASEKSRRQQRPYGSLRAFLTLDEEQELRRSDKLARRSQQIARHLCALRKKLLQLEADLAANEAEFDPARRLREQIMWRAQYRAKAYAPAGLTALPADFIPAKDRPKPKAWKDLPPDVRARRREMNKLAVRRYAERHREKIQMRDRALYAADPEKARAYARQKDARRRRKLKRQADTELLAVVNAAIPRSYPHDIRADITQEMLLAICAKKLRKENIHAEAPNFIRAYWRENDHFKTKSLDAPILGSDGLTLLDLLPAETTEQ